MKTKQLLILIGLIVLTMVFQPVFVKADVPAAVTYLQSQIQDPWITQALVAAGATSVSTDHLASISGTLATDYAKAILALAAVGENPTTFGDIDYVAKLKTYYQNGQIGDEGLLNDDIWAILAFVSIYEVDSIEATGAKEYLRDNQNDDGGWGYNVGGDSDTNDTAAAIMALVEAGVSAEDEAITNAVSYLQSLQNNDGGFPYNPVWGADSDSGSDAWVISALYKIGQNPISWNKDGNNPITHLQSLQDSDGGFWWVEPGTSEWNNKAMTAYAVIALACKSFPVGYYQIPPTSHLVIKGSDGIICDTNVSGNTALEIVENAAGICGYTYNVQDTSYGPYLNQIGNDIAEGMIGWLYYVNTESPVVGADKYELNKGDEVLWYYGEWGWEDIVLEADGESEVAVILSQPISVTVPSTVTDATINVSALKTDDGNKATATLPEMTLNVTTNLSTTPVEVVIPADTVITAPTGWDGIINVPQMESNNSITVTPDSGNTVSVFSVIEIGYGDTELLFDKAVRLLIPESAGKYVGYSRKGSFTKITAVCSADTQAAGSALLAGGNCKIDAGADLIIWTKHFTKFVTYTQAAIPQTQSGGTIFPPITYCQSIEYDEWQDACVDGWQYRNVLSEIPSGCKLAIEQENQRKRQCVQEVGREPIIGEEPIVEVLGIEIILDDQETKKETAQISNTENSGSIIINEAKLIVSGDVNQVILSMNVKRDLAAEVNYNKTIVTKVIADSAVTAEERNLITTFVTYGTDTTKVLGAGERAGVINSYRVAFGKLPTTEAEWNNAIKIANGYLPNQTNADAENRAIKTFKKAYLRNADRTNVNDDLAIQVMAYGLRLANRDLDKEKAGLKIFQDIYGYNPSSAMGWDCVRAIAYSGAKR